MSIVSKYQDRIADGTFKEDDVQRRAARRLDNLARQLKNYEANKKHFFIGKTTPPKGLYLWGGVGRGKSMLMDLFYAEIEVKKKKRVHFHEFMQGVHGQINAWRALDQKSRKRRKNFVKSAGDDPIAPVAKAIAMETSVLCFDEFHVTDIADAMILSRLFRALWSRGVVVVATSNRAPEALYKHGLNRGLFLPFIDELKSYLDIFEFTGDTDHRLRALSKGKVYFSPLNPASNKEIEGLWSRLIYPNTPATKTLSVQGRHISLEAAGDIAKASFHDLCAQALGPADYLEIARAFSTIFVLGVPQLGPEQRNEAKRFVTLIDTLYEARTKLIMEADTEPNHLYAKGDGAFEFDRTVSRLIEMQSLEYLGAEHI